MSTKTDKIDRLGELSAVNQDEQGVSLWTEAFRRVRRSPTALVGMAILMVFIVVAIVGPWVVPYSPSDTMGIREGVIKPGFLPGPSAEHWFGTTVGGYDVLSRVIFGAQTALLVVVVAVVLSLFIGVALGLYAGYFGGWLDKVMVVVFDAIYAFPSLLLAIVLSIVISGGQSSLWGGVLAAGSASALLLALLGSLRTRLTPLALRAAADLVLLTPLVLVLR